jgi:5-methylcytosine-specific restriction endonuclease McrA
MKKAHDTLVLNKAWIPIYIISWRKGMSLIYQNNAHPLDRDYVAYNFEDWLKFSAKNADDYAKIHTVNLSIAVPEIIVLTKYDKLPSRDVKYSRENVFHRDHNKCQYCGVVFSMKELTIDHIIPRCQGGKTVWNNVVACCKPCNNMKADKSLVQAGMKLIKLPTKPRWMNPISNSAGKAHICTSWEKFMIGVDIEKDENKE